MSVFSIFFVLSVSSIISFLCFLHLGHLGQHSRLVRKGTFYEKRALFYKKKRKLEFLKTGQYSMFEHNKGLEHALLFSLFPSLFTVFSVSACSTNVAHHSILARKARSSTLLWKKGTFLKKGHVHETLAATFANSEITKKCFLLMKSKSSVIYIFW